MGFFANDKTKINKDGEILRDKILQIHHIIKEQNKNNLCSFLTEKGIKYTKGGLPLDPEIIWFYPEIPDFTFAMSNIGFFIYGEEEYFGLMIGGDDTDKYSVKVTERSASGKTATKSAKSLQSFLSGYPEFYNLNYFTDHYFKPHK